MVIGRLIRAAQQGLLLALPHGGQRRSRRNALRACGPVTVAATGPVDAAALVDDAAGRRARVARATARAARHPVAGPLLRAVER